LKEVMLFCFQVLKNPKIVATSVGMALVQGLMIFCFL